MGRRPGQRNANFEEKRRLYAQRALQAWLEEGAGSSLRELARACDTSVTNLKHYFGDRDGLFDAIMSEARSQGRPFMDAAGRPEGAAVHEVLSGFLRRVTLAWRQFGVGRIFELSLGEGLAAPSRGRACVDHILEPTLDSGERLIAALIAREDLPPMDVRAASLALLSPLVLGLLNHDAPHGSQCRPRALAALVARHAPT